MTIDRMASRHVFPAARARELAARLNSEASEDPHDGWTYEVEELPGDRARVAVFDETGELVEYL